MIRPPLARGAGLSVYQFDKRMQRIFGITAGQLIQKTRIEAALQRLRGADGSIADIALACGYSDQSAFTRKFREAVGLSPSEYRRSFRGCPAGASAPSMRRARARGEAWPQPS